VAAADDPAAVAVSTASLCPDPLLKSSDNPNAALLVSITISYRVNRMPAPVECLDQHTYACTVVLHGDMHPGNLWA